MDVKSPGDVLSEIDWVGEELRPFGGTLNGRSRAEEAERPVEREQ